MTHVMTHEITGFKPGHGSPKPQYLRSNSRQPKNPKKRLFNPFDSSFDTQPDTRRQMFRHRRFLPTATKLAGTNWHMMTLAEKKEKTPAGKASVQFFHFSPLFAPGQQRCRQRNAVETFLPEPAHSLSQHFITLQNEAV
jgi:hypothetical protein